MGCGASSNMPPAGETAPLNRLPSSNSSIREIKVDNSQAIRLGSGSFEKRPLPPLGSSKPLPGIGGTSSVPSLPPLPQTKIGKNSVAFELNLEGDGPTEVGGPKRVPKRLRRLAPIGSLPTLTSDQLVEKQAAADRKRKRIMDGKRLKSARSSRRRNELMQARAMAESQDDLANPALGIPRSTTPRPVEGVRPLGPLHGDSMPRIKEGRTLAGVSTGGPGDLDADSVPSIATKRFTEDTPLPLAAAIASGMMGSGSPHQSRPSSQTRAALDRRSPISSEKRAPLSDTDSMTGKPPRSPVPPSRTYGSRAGNELSSSTLSLRQAAMLGAAADANKRASISGEGSPSKSFERHSSADTAGAGVTLGALGSRPGSRGVGERSASTKPRQTKNFEGTMNEDEGILSEKDDGADDDWLVDDSSRKKKRGAPPRRLSGVKSPLAEGSSAAILGSGAPLASTRESSAESGVHSADFGGRKQLGLGAGSATSSGVSSTTEASPANTLGVTAGSSMLGKVKGEDDFF